MMQISNNYGLNGSQGWGPAPYSFRDAFSNAYLANAQSVFSNGMPTAYGPMQGLNASLKAAPDPAYAALYALSNQEGAQRNWNQLSVNASYSYGQGIGSLIGNHANAPGTNMPPVWGSYVPPAFTNNMPPVWSSNMPPAVWGGDEHIDGLYNWDAKCPKDEPEEKTHRRRRRPEPDKPDQPEKPRRSVTGNIIGDPVFNGADGEKYKIAGEAGKIYNLMSDKNIQVNGKVEKLPNDFLGYREMGFVVNGGKEIKVSFDANDKMTVKVKEGGKERTLTAAETTDDFTWSPSEPGRAWPKLTIKAEGGQEGERWEFDVTYKATLANSKDGEKSRFLNLGIRGYDIISNEFTTTGLWGHSFDGKKSDVNYKDGTGGGGVLRKSDGSILDKSVQGAEYDRALRGYEMDSLTDTTGGWSRY